MLWGGLVRLRGGGLGWGGMFCFFISLFLSRLVPLASLFHGCVYEVANVIYLLERRNHPKIPDC